MWQAQCWFVNYVSIRSFCQKEISAPGEVTEPVWASQGFSPQGGRVRAADLGRNHHGKKAANEAFPTCFLYQWLLFVISSIAMEL